MITALQNCQLTMYILLKIFLGTRKILSRATEGGGGHRYPIKKLTRKKYKEFCAGAGGHAPPPVHHGEPWPCAPLKSTLDDFDNISNKIRTILIIKKI